MDRFIQCNSELIIGDNEILFEIKDEFIQTLALEFTLMQKEQSMKLVMNFNNSKRVAISIDNSLQPGEKAIIAISPEIVSINCAKNHIEYLQQFLLRAYRDMAAAVNHIHIEGLNGHDNIDLTFLFETYMEPMTSDEARRLLDEE